MQSSSVVTYCCVCCNITSVKRQSTIATTSDSMPPVTQVAPHARVVHTGQRWCVVPPTLRHCVTPPRVFSRGIHSSDVRLSSIAWRGIWAAPRWTQMLVRGRSVVGDGDDHISSWAVSKESETNPGWVRLKVRQSKIMCIASYTAFNA